MLAALLMIGMATAIAAPVFLTSDEDEQDDAEDQSAEMTAPDTDSTTSDIAALPETNGGATYDVPVGGGVVALKSFVPGEDRLQIHFDTEDADYSVVAPEDGGVALAYSAGGEPVVISFPELDSVPFEDIDIIVDENPAAVLAPSDPDTPDLPPEPLDLEPLSPEAGDAVDTPPEITMNGPVLAPVPADAADAYANLPEVSGFVAGQDILKVTILSDLAPDDITVEVVPSADGEDGYVFANGDIIAILRDAPDITQDDLDLMVQPQSVVS